MSDKRACETILIHYVPSDSQTGGWANIHTHGVSKNYNHPDLQIVLNIPPEVATAILNGIVDCYIDIGMKLKDGEFNPHLLHESVVKTVLTTESGREVFRIILPDPNGYFPEDLECAEGFNQQYSGLSKIVH